MKKCRFYQEEVQFLGYVVSSQGILIQEEKTDALKAWPKPKSVQNIQLFIGFTNFYWHFIEGFNKITAPLTLILKTSLQLANALLATGLDNIEVVGSSGRNDRKSAKSDFTKPVRKVEESSFLTPDTRRVFTQLR